MDNRTLFFSSEKLVRLLVMGEKKKGEEREQSNTRLHHTARVGSPASPITKPIPRIKSFPSFSSHSSLQQQIYSHSLSTVPIALTITCFYF